MDISFEGKVAVVTGGASGIGRATAAAFAESGAAVVVADIDPDGASFADELTAAGHRAKFVRTDVSVESDVVAMVETGVREFGSVDLAFNGAAYEGAIASVADQELIDVERVLSVNLRGLWLCVKHELRQMMMQGSGSIVNCASVGGLRGVPGMPIYAASKHGVIGITKTAALEYASRGIRVNAVCPGLIETAMSGRVAGDSPEVLDRILAVQPNGRLGQPEEIASAVVWLSSSAASFVNGEALVLDGGRSAR